MTQSFKLKHYVHRTMETVKDGFTSRLWPLRPQALNFEITSICDSKCIHCPRHEMERTMRPMPFELFKKLIDEAAELKIPELRPNGYGEMMTMRNMDQYLDYVSTKDHKFKITINTNAYRMTEEKLEVLIRNKVDLLNICIDGATKEVAETVRVGLELDVIEKNILRLMQIRKERGLSYPRIKVGFIQIPQNSHEVSAFIEKWTGKVDFVGVDAYSNRGGSLDEKMNIAHTPSIEGTCALPFRDLNIYADGKAVLCCNDWNEEYVVGDFNTQSLKDIWHSKEMTAARDAHIRKRGGEINFCSKCNFWVTPTAGAKLWK